MTESPNSGDDLLHPSKIDELLGHILRSVGFRDSTQLQTLLKYIVAGSLNGDDDALKERIIGIEVFGRKADYDTAEDPIVRSRVGHLRKRLAQYYEGEQARVSKVQIDIPIGSYRPVFILHPDVKNKDRNGAGAGQLQAAPSNGSKVAAVPSAPPVVEPASPQTPRQTFPVRRYWLFYAASVLTAVLATVALTAYVLESGRRVAVAPQGGAIHDFWGQFFDKPGKELKVVYSDASFGFSQFMNDKTMNLGDYLSHKYFDSADDRLRQAFMSRTTWTESVSVSVHLATLTAQFGGQIIPQYARSVNSEFFQRGNVVLLGNHLVNPWAEVYEPYLNFVFEQNAESSLVRYVNRSPQPHESAVYAAPENVGEKGGEETMEFTSYGRLALLERCSDRGFLVLADGLTGQARVAAGDLITDPQRLEALLSSIGHRRGTNVAPFEALIQITSLPGGYDNPKVVAYRQWPAGSCVGN